MPAPHTAATAAEQPAAALPAAKLLPSEAIALPPPAAPASPPPPPPPPAPPSTSTAPSSAPFVSAAALAAIADIESKGEASGDADAVAELVAGLEGEKLKTIPCSFLYDGPGSALYDAITDLEAYYPYGAETRLLDSQSDAIAAAIPVGAVLVELGCGSATKTPRLLAAVARKNREKSENSSVVAVRYAGIDVSADFLANARANVTASGAVADADVETFCNRYLEGAAAARAAHEGEDLCFLWLGSSVGNLDAGSAAAFVRELFAAASAASSDEGKGACGGKGKGGGKTQLLLCTDLWKDEKRLRAAYDDDRGVTAAFMRNGLRHALACVEVLPPPQEEEGKSGGDATATTALRVAAAAGAAPAAWRYEVDVNPVDEQVEMYLVCPSDFELRIPPIPKRGEEEEGGSCGGGGGGSAAAASASIRFAKGERVLMEVSRKYTLERIEALAASSGVKLAGRWVTEDYGIQLLE